MGTRQISRRANFLVPINTTVLAIFCVTCTVIGASYGENSTVTMLSSIQGLTKGGRVEEAGRKLAELLRMEQITIPEIVQNYAPTHIEFKALLIATQLLPYIKDQCEILQELRNALKSHGKSGTPEEIVIWYRAQVLLQKTTMKDLSRHEDLVKCVQLYSQRPTHMHTFQRQYAQYVDSRSFSTIKEWHRDYHDMIWILVDVILPNVERDLLRAHVADDWADFFIEVLNNNEKCLALKAMYDKLNNQNLLGYHEHFRIAFHASRLLDNSGDIDEESRRSCSVVRDSAPKNFKILISGNTGNCKIRNQYDREPLYCTADSRKDKHGRKIYTWAPADDDEDQYWEINIRSKDARVSFRNRYHNKYLSHVEGDMMRGVDDNTTEGTYFRVIHVDDGVYFRIESNKNFGHIMSGNFKWDLQRRFVDMNEGNGRHPTWALEC